MSAFENSGFRRGVLIGHDRHRRFALFPKPDRRGVATGRVHDPATAKSGVTQGEINPLGKYRQSDPVHDFGRQVRSDDVGETV